MFKINRHTVAFCNKTEALAHDDDMMMMDDVDYFMSLLHLLELHLIRLDETEREGERIRLARLARHELKHYCGEKMDPLSAAFADSKRHERHEHIWAEQREQASAATEATDIGEV